MSELHRAGRAERCLAELSALLAGLPGLLREALLAELPARPGRLGSVVTTGIGASEPPARLLARLLVAGGVPARFCATSRFLRADAPRADLLVSFSQGLSPNALLAFAEPTRFSARWLVTAVGEACPRADKRAERAQLEATGVRVLCLPPPDEPAWLVRMAGPTVAALGAARLAAHLLGDPALQAACERAPAAYARGCGSPACAPLPAGTAVCFIAVDTPEEAALAHRCKLMEALLLPEPPVWDVLQFAHGPLQAYHLAPLVLLSLEGASDDELARRLADTLDPARHQLRRFASPEPGICAWFAHAASVDQLVLASLRETPRDLYDWPAKCGDAPLYELGKRP